MQWQFKPDCKVIKGSHGRLLPGVCRDLRQGGYTLCWCCWSFSCHEKNRRNPADSLEMCKAQPGECQRAPPTWCLLCAQSRALLVVPPAFPSRLHPSRRPVGSQISSKLLFCPFFQADAAWFLQQLQIKKATAVPSAQAEPFLSRAVAVTCGVVPEESCWKSRDHEFHSVTDN